MVLALSKGPEHPGEKNVNKMFFFSFFFFFFLYIVFFYIMKFSNELFDARGILTRAADGKLRIHFIRPNGGL